ncbi:hypothetical protein GCM10023149_50550 [Mucilaginibacter gynuensis]|uniref:Uncharacterized protein n=1 Tax=Mucilaginibacter gynuensis TaxID=1302236 RepID=A0ABP8HIP1_9SPHI
MWKKLRSNRDPRDTLLSELKKEFGPYIIIGTIWLKRLLLTYPRCFFGGMVGLLAVSLLFSFTLFLHPGSKAKISTEQVSATADDSFSKIIAITGRMQETIVLKKTVDSLNRKPQLSAQDSARMIKTLQRLQQLLKQ